MFSQQDGAKSAFNVRGKGFVPLMEYESWTKPVEWNMKVEKRNLITVFLMLTRLGFTQTVQEAAVPYQRPSRVPAASDVQMRTLRFRPRNPQDDQNTFKAMDDFHVTRLEWTYLEASEPGTTDPESLAADLKNIKRTKAVGRIFGGTANASSGTYVKWDPVGNNHEKKHTIVDRNGHPVIAGHMRYWKQPQSPGCANNPHYRQGHLEYLKKYIDAGATVIQRDEPSGQYSYAKNGSGCFCNYCMEGFRNYLEKHVVAEELAKLGVRDVNTFNYKEHLNAIMPPPKTDYFDWSDPRTVKRMGGGLHKHFEQFQMDSCTVFFEWTRKEVKAYNGGVQLGYSCNNTSFQNWEDPYILTFDYCISEMMMQTGNPSHIYGRAQAARKLGKLQVFGTPKTMGTEFDETDLVRLKQQVLATAYASGANGSVPWDVFMQSKDGNARYFCKPEDFSPLFGFVRANDRYLGGYCTAGGKGPGFEDNPFDGAF
ncbi:MAG: hypothetical protein U9P12_09995, partial [Verrucomicrobiota bacterium]|nr:hypothetical protein [Verrucomicrobiota bacterium]